MTKPLADIRILLLEDEFLIATMAADMLGDLGATVIGPLQTVAAALEKLEETDPDCAVLDVNLKGETSSAVADVLLAKGIPFIFATGHGPDGIDAVVLSKPYTERKLHLAIEEAMAKGNTDQD